jgi:DNA-binding beta-propeller fold protein YncE
MNRSKLFVGLLALGISVPVLAQQYKVTGQVPIEGAGGWDYAYVDASNRQLYIAHNTQVDVVNLDTEKPVATITGMAHVHGIATADDLNRGFISDGGDNVVVVFDLKSNAVLQRVKAGTNADGILYDAPSQRVLT